MPKRLKVLVIAFVALAALSAGGFYGLVKGGYIASQAYTFVPQVCQSGNITIKAKITDPSGKLMNGVRVNTSVEDCNGTLNSGEPSTSDSCLTGENRVTGECTDVAGAKKGAGQIPVNVYARRNMGSYYWKADYRFYASEGAPQNVPLQVNCYSMSTQKQVDSSFCR